MSRKQPKGLKGFKRKLREHKSATNAEIKRAMLAAGVAIDDLNAQQVALRRMLIAERAQVIYYTEMALGYSRRTIVEPTLTAFLDLAEEKQELYVKAAVAELHAPEPTVPHKGILLTDADVKVQ